MSEKENNAEFPSKDEGETTEEISEAVAESEPDAGAGLMKKDPVDSEADTLADEGEQRSESAGEAEPTAQPSAEEEKEEEKKVAYELIEATPRAGSIVDLKFKVPYSQYEDKTGEFYKELRQTVIIDGFRRGKAPLKLIQNRYRKQVEKDTLDFLISNCLGQITKEKDFTVLREFDRVDPKVTENEPLEFAVSLEIHPQIDPVGYDSFDITVDTIKVDDDAVDAEIEKIRRRHATFQASDILTYETGYGVTVDIRVTDDKSVEIEELTRKDLFLSHPENSLPEPVVRELIGKRAGESFLVEVPNVRKSEGGVITSQHDMYHVKVRAVKREVLPELDDEFAKDLGADSLEALRSQMREHLEASQERRLRDDSLEKIYTMLIEKNQFDVPETMVRQAQARIVHEHEERLRALGFRLEDLGEDPKDYILRTRANAERLLRTLLLNQAIAKKEKIEATDEDVDRAIERRAAEEGRRPLAIRAQLEAHRQMDAFRDDLKHDLVEDFLLSRAKINKQYVAPGHRIDEG